MTTRTQNQDVEALKEELASLRTDVASLVEAMKHEQRAVTTSDKPQGEESGSEQWNELKAKIEEARQQSEQISREVSEEVRRHPLASIAIAFGIGYIASKIIK